MQGAYSRFTQQQVKGIAEAVNRAGSTHTERDSVEIVLLIGTKFFNSITQQN